MVLLSHADDLVDESVDLRLFSVHDIPLHGSRGFRSQVGQDLQVHLHIIFLKRDAHRVRQRHDLADHRLECLALLALSLEIGRRRMIIETCCPDRRDVGEFLQRIPADVFRKFAGDPAVGKVLCDLL